LLCKCTALSPNSVPLPTPPQKNLFYQTLDTRELAFHDLGVTVAA
jgi:hypothetical protein